MEDRSALFNQLKNFSQRKLKKVETKVVTASGEQLVEKRGAKGLQVLSGGGAVGAKEQEAEPPRKLDLQVGFILPGLLIGSQDVAHDKSSLDSYGITHILNLDSGVSNKFEDDINYKNVNIQDKPDFILDNIFEDCFDFIDDGRHYGNVFVHCAGTIGLSRSTSICIAYLMNKEKQKLDEAFNNVKEARSFVKPNEGFMKQLKDYEIKLRGAQQVKDSGIDDPFALRKKQEIEQEKAMVAGAASVKNRMKMFGATLDTGGPNSARSKSVSPSPFKSPEPPSSKPPSKWSSSSQKDSSNTISKSMTPEPRKSWQPTTPEPPKSTTSDWRSRQQQSGGNPPPPPPMPSGLHANDKSVKSLGNNNKSLPPPPPPPPPPADDSSIKRDSINSSTKSTTSSTADSGKSRMVFGKVPPPSMKIRGGLSTEKVDPTSERNQGHTKNQTRSSPNPKMTIVHTQSQLEKNQQAFVSPDSGSCPNRRCESPLVLINNTSGNKTPPVREQSGFLTPQISDSSSNRKVVRRRPEENESGVVEELAENPFKFWQNTMTSTQQAPKRTVSLGPKRQLDAPGQPLGQSSLSNNPFLKGQRNNFDKAANDLKSSLTELNKLIDSTPPTPVRNKTPRFSNYHNYIMTLTPDPSGEPSTRNIENSCNTDDPLNRRASTSINDLRSVFESKSSSMGEQNKLQVNTLSRRPPHSPSPSILKNSPWHELAQKPQTPQLPRADPQQTRSSTHRQLATNPESTIRRTTSTNSRPPREIHNPYRGHY